MGADGGERLASPHARVTSYTLRRRAPTAAARASCVARSEHTEPVATLAGAWEAVGNGSGARARDTKIRREGSTWQLLAEKGETAARTSLKANKKGHASNTGLAAARDAGSSGAKVQACKGISTLREATQRSTPVTPLTRASGQGSRQW